MPGAPAGASVHVGAWAIEREANAECMLRTIEGLSKPVKGFQSTLHRTALVDLA